jgi:SAM-dependent methyltransferase
MTGATNFYATPELAQHYDADCEGRTDFPFYLALARRLATERVVDIGAGTGLLGSLLAAQGHEVIGVEPQVTMLELARAQPNADKVHWIHGTATDLPSDWADLVIMTGHVAQYFPDDDAWRQVLAAARRSLRAGGRLAFEIRNAALEEWRSWQTDGLVPGPVGHRRRTVRRDGDLVTHLSQWTGDGRTWTTTETLRFPSWAAMTAGLTATGFTITETWGDFNGSPLGPTSPEWVILAART